MSEIPGSEHWTTKRTDSGEVRLFLWRKHGKDTAKGTILFVHGSSMASQPVFDLQIARGPGPNAHLVLTARAVRDSR